uniref:Ig-like domain-containing protein n=1 Tax=Myotis lucifugus TaxID=59463 RepID=G1QAQ1_MYOLU
GSYSKPSLSSLPSPVVPSGGNNLTLQCRSDVGYDRFALHKEGEPDLSKSLFQAEFSMSPVTSAHGGTYRCYSSHSSSPFLLSLPSEPLELLVSGVGDAPSLSAQPSPVVASGGNVSLSCSSQFTSGPFHLLKEGGADPPRRMEAEWRIHAGRRWAIFPLGPLSPNHGGTYRCYGSSSSYPNVWSQPSAPLHIEVTG